jgi:hypothetical protein
MFENTKLTPFEKRKNRLHSPSSPHPKNAELPLDISLLGLTLEEQIAVVRQRYFQEVERYTQEYEKQSETQISSPGAVPPASIYLLIDKLYELVNMKRTRSRFLK